MQRLNIFNVCLIKTVVCWNVIIDAAAVFNDVAIENISHIGALTLGVGRRPVVCADKSTSTGDNRTRTWLAMRVLPRGNSCSD